MQAFGTIMDNAISHLISVLIDKSSERGNVQSKMLCTEQLQYVELS